MLPSHSKIAVDGREAFAHFVKPRLMELLQAIGLDVVYERGEGDSLYYDDAEGREVEVLDLLGGFGASLFGHNHPELVSRAKEALDRRLPFNAQASARGVAGLLAQRLAEMVGRATGRDYVVTFANSGTEAVEAAIKHAEIELALRIDRILDRLKRTRKEIRLRLRDHTAHIPEETYQRVAHFFDVSRIDDLDELFVRVFRYDLDALGREPVFLAIEGAFHGKSTGSLKLTYNPDYRSPWRRIGLRAVFLPPGDVAAIQQEVERARVRYLDLELSPEGELRLVERDLLNIPGCFVEPIQGEGGIREMPADYLRALRKAADQGGFPLVFDEIQSGMGRTGTFCASEASGVRGDYYLFSKALGGGLAKLSALLVDRERYESEYGYLHTSTFADDDLSCSIGLAAIELLERDDGALMKRCRAKGDRLLEKLRAVRARHPTGVADVRGRGLMIGLELGRNERSRSPLVRVLSEQNMLGFIVSGWLLHEARVRVAPTLSAHGTIRVEPSAQIGDGEIDRFADAVEKVVSIIEDADAYRLVRFMVGRAGQEPAGPAPRPRDEPDFKKPGWSPSRFARKVAFLGHFLEPRDLADWDPALAPLTDDDCGRFLERTRGLLDPFIVERKELRSLGGDVTSLTVIGLAFTAQQAIEALRSGDSRWVLALIEKGVALAKRLGCSIVGFGGYTSIVTDNCRAIVEEEMALTSGNSLTAVAAIEALDLAARRVGIERPRLGVLGGAGNIGAVMAEVLADRYSDLVLVGRAASGARRLERVAAEVYFGAWKRLTRQGAHDGLAGAIAGTKTLRALVRDSGGIERIGEAIRSGLEEELGERAPVRIATDMDALRECNLIVTATNAARPIVRPEHLGPGPIVICDVAAPRDVDPSVDDERKDVVVLRGGLVRAPLGQTLEIGGMRLERGQLFGCLAETVLLGFAASGEHFSYGRLSAVHLRRIRELAKLHGFEVDERRA